MPAVGAQLAGRAFAAAGAPVVHRLAPAEIAGVALGADQLDEILAAEPLGQRPGLGLAELHQRRLDREAALHAELERGFHGIDGATPAVRIAGEVGLAHAANESL